MAIQYFARVRSATDHEAFQRVVKHYPSCTYDEWHFREAKKMADEIRNFIRENDSALKKKD